MNNPILATLKAKRGLQTDIGFGSKPPKPRNTASVNSYMEAEKPEHYLGPGYYECKGGFDNYAPTPNYT